MRDLEMLVLETNEADMCGRYSWGTRVTNTRDEYA